MRKLLSVEVGVLRLVLAALFCTSCAGRNAPAVVPTRSLAADPLHDPAPLNQEQAVWYTRLWEAIDGSTYPDPDQAAASGNTYAIGRPLQQHILALMTAFRVTHDLRLLDETDRLMELARA